MNLFDWSLPFVAEKCCDIWKFLITRCTERELINLPDEKELDQILKGESDKEQQKLKARFELKKKLQSVGVMQ